MPLNKSRFKPSLSYKSIHRMLGLPHDLPFVGYWKVTLLEKLPTELYERLLTLGKSSDEDANNVKGKYIGAEIMRKLCLEKDPLALILKVHLLFENLINEVLAKNKIPFNNITFKNKLNILKKKRKLINMLYEDLSLLNYLRNSYSHNYYYELSSFSIENFSCAHHFYDGIECQDKHIKALLNLKAMQFYIFPDILNDFLNKFHFLINTRLKPEPVRRFYSKSTGERLGELIDEIHQTAKKPNLELSVVIKGFDKSSDNARKKFPSRKDLMLKKQV